MITQCTSAHGAESVVGPSGLTTEDMSSLAHIPVIQQITWMPRKPGSCPHCLTWAGSLVSSRAFAPLCQELSDRAGWVTVSWDSVL